jgi:hypothetical protein
VVACPADVVVVSGRVGVVDPVVLVGLVVLVVEVVVVVAGTRLYCSPFGPVTTTGALWGGYRCSRIPNPIKATIISRVDRRIGSSRWTGTDMYPTNLLCFRSASGSIGEEEAPLG